MITNAAQLDLLIQWKTPSARLCPLRQQRGHHVERPSLGEPLHGEVKSSQAVG